MANKSTDHAASVLNQAGGVLSDAVDYFRLDPIPPVFRELRSYDRFKLRADLLAGATVALVSIPQAVGFALIAGLPPEMVIMSVVVGGFLAALFTTSHHVVFGPTNSISLLIASAIATLPTVGLAAPQLVLVLALLIGVFQIVAGFAKLGKLTQFVSRSVIIGYGTAIGILLAVGQLPNFFGAETTRGNLFRSLEGMVQHLVSMEVNIYAVAIGVVTLLLFHFLERFSRWVPAELLGLVLVSLFTRWVGLDSLGVRTIAGEGALAGSLPSFGGMPFGAESMAAVPALMGTALAIAILGMLEAISIGKTLAARSGQPFNPNQELMAMGAANLGCSAFGAMPGSASFARSGANLQSGARTQVAALSSSLMVLGALYFVAPLINFLPIPALAAHLMRIGLKMINREQLRIAWRATRSDAIVLVATMLSAFLFKLDAAIYVGLGLSLALFLKKASAPSLVEYGFNEQGQLAQLEPSADRGPSTISIVHVEGELFFGAADLFQDEVRLRAEAEDIRVVILRMKNARHLDATSVMSLLQLHESLTKAKRHLLISGINPDVEAVLRRSGAWETLGTENIFPAEANLTMSTKRALQRAKRLLAQDGSTGKAEVRVYYDRKRMENQTPTSGGAAAVEHVSDYEI
ncbi:MAG: SulP family inorganic anion transporter [Verrucomicrobia bacterium]|nr:SulP family inorganic anion transporter [Verrucomicrobiota bacterium]